MSCVRRRRPRTSAFQLPLLKKFRLTGNGPAYQKAGPKIVVYRVEDLQSWVDAAAKASTSDPGKVIVLPAKRHTPAELEQARQPRR